MRRNWVGLTLAALLPAACDDAGGPGTRDAPLHAPGVAARPEAAVDGMTVGHRLMAAGEYELALKAFYRAAAQDGLTPELLSALGSANLQLGRLGQAEDLLRRAVAEDESSAPAWNNLGVVLIERGSTGEAERVFRRAYALDSGDSPQIRDNLRLALAKLENPGYTEPNNEFALVRQGGGLWQLQPAN